jgi:hypothetical protein
MLFKPLSHRHHGAFVCLGWGVRSVKDANLSEQDDGHSAAFALADLSTKPSQQGFDVFPGDIGAGWMCEDGFQRLQVSALHPQMVLNHGTDHKPLEFCCGGRLLLAPVGQALSPSLLPLIATLGLAIRRRGVAAKRLRLAQCCITSPPC